MDCTGFNRGPKFSWQQTKLFLFGSLVVFSFDHFLSFATGLIRNADHSEMDTAMRNTGKCRIFVEVVNTAHSLLETFKHFKNKSLVLLESKLYFQAFQDNHEVLRNMQKLPMPRVFLKNSSQHIQAPEFLEKKFCEGDQRNKKNQKSYKKNKLSTNGESLNSLVEG